MSASDGWFKSSFSGAGQCVEVRLHEGISVRDSKDPSGPVLRFTDHEWTAFLKGVRHGEFDLSPRSQDETDAPY
jgi:hypothetical protein